MDFDFTEDQESLRDAVRRWVDKDYDFARRHASVKAGGFSREAWDGLVGLGLTGLAVPEAHGGLGFGAVDAMVVMEELGRGIVMEPYAQAGLIAPTVADHDDTCDVGIVGIPVDGAIGPHRQAGAHCRRCADAGRMRICPCRCVVSDHGRPWRPWSCRGPTLRRTRRTPPRAARTQCAFSLRGRAPSTRCARWAQPSPCSPQMSATRQRSTRRSGKCVGGCRRCAASFTRPACWPTPRSARWTPSACMRRWLPSWRAVGTCTTRRSTIHSTSS